MEPPHKRIRLSQEEEPERSPSIESRGLQLFTPTRTVDPSVINQRGLSDILHRETRPQPKRRNAGIVLRPRAPDVTVTANVIDIAVNNGAVLTQIAAPVAETAVSLSSLGVLTIPAVEGLTSIVNSLVTNITPTILPSLLPSDQGLSTFPANGTSTTGGTVIKTKTSTLHVTYTNGTLVQPSTTRHSNHTTTRSSREQTITFDSDSESATYTFGQGITYTTPTTAVYGNVGLNGATATHTSTGAKTTSSNESGPASPGLTQEQAQVVGGVVGSVAGVALILVVLLYLLRWYRQRLKSQGRLPEQLGGSDNHATDPHSDSKHLVQTQASKIPVGMFSSLKKWRTQSQFTVATNTTSTTAGDSEKGFQRIAGRKIPSVLSNGGDGYGGGYGVFEKGGSENYDLQDLSGSPSDRFSAGTMGDHGRPHSLSAPNTPSLTSFLDPQSGRIHRIPSFATMGTNGSQRDYGSYSATMGNSMAAAMAANSNKPDGFAMMRSSPARTPITQSPTTSSFTLPIQAPITMGDNVPAMPSVGLGIGRGADRVPSQLSMRSGSSNAGRFKENLV